MATTRILPSRVDIAARIRYPPPVQHTAALQVIRALGPQLEKSAAEEVLTAYAKENDLAPAQLEKLAQTYNTVRQLSHIDASEDRGTTCHQIDTPALVRSYVDAPEKSATVTRVMQATHDASSVDLMHALRQEITPMAKAASEAPGADDPGANEITHPSIPGADPEADIRYTPAQLKEAAWEAKVDLYLVADAILKAAAVDGRYLLLSTAEHDALRQVNPERVIHAMDWLEKYAAQQSISRLIDRHVGPIKAATVALSSPMSDRVVALTEAFTATTLCAAIAKSAGIAVGDLPAEGAIDPSAMDDLLGKLEQEVPEVPPERGEGPIGGGKGGLGTPVSELDLKGDSREKDSDGGGGKGGGAEKGAPPAKGGAHWLASLIGASTKPVAAAGNAASAVAGAAQNAVHGVTGKERVNKAQIGTDTSVNDIKRSIMIRRLAANDPVLKDMDLREVLETYNAIAESNPELAANPRRVLLAMREAASYEGITLDAQKQLGDIRGAASKTDAQEAENTKRRYTA